MELPSGLLLSSISNASYYHHPVDLLCLSGTLSLEHEVYVLEALGQHLSPSLTYQEIERINTDAIISLISGLGFDEDSFFIRT